MEDGGCTKGCLGKAAGEPLMTQQPLDVSTGADHRWEPFRGSVELQRPKPFGGRALNEGFKGSRGRRKGFG